MARFQVIPSFRVMIAGVGALLVLDATSHPGRAATAVGHASVTLLPAISVTETAAMDLGSIGITKAAGTVILTPAGRVSGPSGYSFTGVPNPGQFTVVGAPNAAVGISFSRGDAMTGPGPALALGDFTHNAGASPALSSTGTLTFAVGAAVTIGAAQPTGGYSGTYSVVVNY